MTGEQGTTNWYVCTKCEQPCDVEEVIDMSPAAWRTVGINVRTMHLSQCCNAPVRVASSKAGDGG